MSAFDPMSPPPVHPTSVDPRVLSEVDVPLQEAVSHVVSDAPAAPTQPAPAESEIRQSGEDEREERRDQAPPQQAVELSDIMGLLGQVRREIIETRNLTIKTDNLVNLLGSELKQVSRTQQAHHRKYIFNSSVSYLLFVGLTFTGLYLTFDAHLSGARDEVAQYQARTILLEERFEDVDGELRQRREAENLAYDFYELIASGHREEVIEQFNALQAQLVDRAMVELLRDRVEALSFELAEDAYREGLSYVQSERWVDARDAFLKSLSHLERTPWAPSLHYYIGYALYRLDDYQGALHYFEDALTYEDLDDGQRGQAMYRRGVSLQNVGQHAEAIETYRQFRREYPAHRYSARALREINRMERSLEESED